MPRNEPLTAHQLAQKLLAGPDLPVHMAYNFGDYWKTTVAPQITKAEEGTVTYSDYHNMDKLVAEDDFDGEDPKQRQVIILD